MERQDTDTWTHDPEQAERERIRQQASRMLATIDRRRVPSLRPRVTPGIIVMLVALAVIAAFALLGVL